MSLRLNPSMESIRKLSARLSPSRERRRSSLAVVSPSPKTSSLQHEDEEEQPKTNCSPLVARSPSAKVSPSSLVSSSSSSSLGGGASGLLQPDEISSVIRGGDTKLLKAFLSALKGRSRKFKLPSLFYAVHSTLVMCADVGR